MSTSKRLFLVSGATVVSLLLLAGCTAQPPQPAPTKTTNEHSKTIGNVTVGEFPDEPLVDTTITFKSDALPAGYKNISGETGQGEPVPAKDEDKNQVTLYNETNGCYLSGSIVPAASYEELVKPGQSLTDARWDALKTEKGYERLKTDYKVKVDVDGKTTETSLLSYKVTTKVSEQANNTRFEGIRVFNTPVPATFDDKSGMKVLSSPMLTVSASCMGVTPDAELFDTFVSNLTVHAKKA